PVFTGPLRPARRDGDEPVAGHQPALSVPDAAQHRWRAPARAQSADAGTGQSHVLAVAAAGLCRAAQPAVGTFHRTGSGVGLQPTAQPLVVEGRSWGWPG